MSVCPFVHPYYTISRWYFRISILCSLIKVQNLFLLLRMVQFSEKIHKIFLAQTFLTRGFPGPNFFKLSLPGGLRIFQTFASLLNLANIWRPWSGLPFEGIHLWYCVLLKPTLSCPLFIKFTQDKVNRVKYKPNKDFFKLFSYQLLFKLFLEPNIFSAAGSFYIWPDLCSMVRTISATIVFSGKTICQKLHLLRKNTCQKCRKLVYVI